MKRSSSDPGLNEFLVQPICGKASPSQAKTQPTAIGRDFPGLSQLEESRGSVHLFLRSTLKSTGDWQGRLNKENAIRGTETTFCFLLTNGQPRLSPFCASRSPIPPGREGRGGSDPALGAHAPLHSGKAPGGGIFSPHPWNVFPRKEGSAGGRLALFLAGIPREQGLWLVPH